MQIVFETPRLILRKFTEKDFPLIQKLNSNPEVVKYLHEPVFENEEQAKNILTNIGLTLNFLLHSKYSVKEVLKLPNTHQHCLLRFSDVGN